MTALPNILFAKGTKTDDLGEGILIYNDILPVVGRIVLYDSYLDMLGVLNNKMPVAYTIIQGYSIAIIFGGILGRGNRLSPSDLPRIESVLMEFSNWYTTNRLMEYPGRYKRYKI